MMGKRHTRQTEDEKVEAESGRWQLSAACCIERIPSLAPEAPQDAWYQDYVQMQEQFEEDYNRTYTFEEIKERMDQWHKSQRLSKKQAKRSGPKMAERKMRSVLGMEEIAEDDQEKDKKKSVKEKSSGLWVVPRQTQADLTNEVRAVNRALDRHLYLFLHSSNQGGRWDFPTIDWQEGETMRATAERAMEEYVGKGVHAVVQGNAPVGHLVERFDEAESQKTGLKGRKVFYYRAVYVNGQDILAPQDITDYAWLTREEIADRTTRHEAFPVLCKHMLW